MPNNLGAHSQIQQAWVAAIATCCQWIMHFITRIYQIVSLPDHSHNARYEG
ncbi:MAG: hypothetical protein ACRD72_09405 [Candidatus Angelobacter sp.]|jgi:hypothetical protein